VSAIVFSKDGKELIAAAADDSAIRRYRVETARPLPDIGSHAGGVTGLALSPDGAALASVGWEGKLMLSDLTKEAKPRIIDLQGQTLSAVAFYPNGKYVAVAAHDGAIRTFDTGTLKLSLTLSGRRNRPMLALAITPNGRVLVGGGQQSKLQRWHAVSGELDPTFSMGSNMVFGLAFSPDGCTLAVGDFYGEVWLYETATGEVRGHFAGHDGACTALAFTPDGRALASTGRDLRCFVWDLTGLRTGNAAPAKHTEAELRGLWTKLSLGDAQTAYRAGWLLADTPADSVAFLKEQIAPANVLDLELVARLLKQLDDRNFKVRRAAAAELEAIGPRVRPHLQKALGDDPSAEVRRQIGMIQSALSDGGPGRDAVRGIRAVEVLERIGTKEAKQLVETLAAGLAGAPQTDAAKEALARWKR
jgi:hypothetical protein